MSVQSLDLRLYQQVYVTICRHLYRKENSLSHITFSEGQLRLQIAMLAEMNYVSCYTRYPEPRGIDWECIQFVKDCISNWSYNHLKAQPCSDVQLYKYLQCIEYQIESEHMKSKKTWKIEYDAVWLFLKNAIHIVSGHIISSLPEYEEAKWSSV